MAKPNRMSVIQREFGKPGETLEDTLVRLLNEHGGIPPTAQVIDISMHNLFLWCQRLGIQKRVTWEKSDESALSEVVNEPQP